MFRPVHRTRRRRRYGELPVIYASGRGRASLPPTWRWSRRTCEPLFDAHPAITCPAPDVDEDAPLQMQVMALQYNEFVGKIVIGRVLLGKIKKNQKVHGRQAEGRHWTFPDTVVQVLGFDRLAKREVEEIRARRRVRGCRLDDADIGDTICEFDKPKALRSSRSTSRRSTWCSAVNDSPVCEQGREAAHQPRTPRARLEQELQHNVARASRRVNAKASSSSAVAGCFTSACCSKRCGVRGRKSRSASRE